MTRPRKLVWIARTATPQFVPVLSRLHQLGLPVEAHFLAAGSRGRGWGELSLPFPHVFAPIGFRQGVWAGLRLGRSRDLDGVVVFGYNSVYVIATLLAARMRRVPIFTQSDSNLEDHLRAPLWRRALKRILLRAIYPRNTRVWVIGKSNSRYWLLQGLRNQREVAFESPVPELTFRRESLGSSKTVLFVGRIDAGKRVHDAFHSVAMLRARRQDDIRLRLVGRGDLLEFLSVKELPAWVEVVGPVPHAELAREYLNSDVLVLPSAHEAYGLVVREALQFGLPVVGSDRVTAIVELCDRGWNRVPVGDIAGLARSLNVALDSGRWETVPPQDVALIYAEELRTCSRY